MISRARQARCVSRERVLCVQRPLSALLVPLLLVLGLGCVTQAQAMTIRQLRTLEANEKEGVTYANYYLVGVIEGLREAADSAAREGRRPPFCVESRRLDPAMARSLYQGELGRNAESYEADMPVQLVLSSALRTSYRCTR